MVFLSLLLSHLSSLVSFIFPSLTPSISFRDTKEIYSPVFACLFLFVNQFSDFFPQINLLDAYQRNCSARKVNMYTMPVPGSGVIISSYGATSNLGVLSFSPYVHSILGGSHLTITTSGVYWYVIISTIFLYSSAFSFSFFFPSFSFPFPSLPLSAPLFFLDKPVLIYLRLSAVIPPRLWTEALPKLPFMPNLEALLFMQQPHSLLTQQAKRIWTFTLILPFGLLTLYFLVIWL